MKKICTYRAHEQKAYGEAEGQIWERKRKLVWGKRGLLDWASKNRKMSRENKWTSRGGYILGKISNHAQA